MSELTISSERLTAFAAHLRAEERSPGTIENYLRHIRAFAVWLDGSPVTKETAAAWKEHLLTQDYAPATVNAMLAALNGLFHFLGWDGCRVKFLRVQRRLFRDAGRELTRPEYERLMETARSRGQERLALLMETICATGIRVSECVGLDIQDIDFDNNGIRIVRKGGNETIVYFGDEVADALKAYLPVREGITPIAGHENALFYSTQRRRIGVQAVENMVKKYARAITTTKKITPHKLRSTYGTSLYRETGDIYLVAEVLGHKDVNTTRKHYAAMGEDRRRQAASAVHLRKD